MVCLEFKPPSEIGCSLAESFMEPQFILQVNVIGGGNVFIVNPNLKNVAGDRIKKGEGDKVFRMFVDEGDNYGAEHGIYYAMDEDKNIALRKAKQKCLAGTDDYESAKGMTSDNWAVQFNGKDEIIGH